MRSIALLCSCLVFASSAALAQDFSFAIDGPERIESATGDKILRYEATSTLTSQDVSTVLGAQAWSVGMRAIRAEIVAATIAGTAGATTDDDPPGLRSDGFEHTELTTGDGNRGVVSAVVLSFAQPISMPRDGTGKTLSFTVEATVPTAGCDTIRIEFVDGLSGIGQPVNNSVIYDGQTMVPTQTIAETLICSFPRIEIEPSSLNFEGVLVDETSTLSATIRNAGNAVLDISEASFDAGSSSDFELDADPGSSLAPGASRELRFTFRPQSETESGAVYRILSTDPDLPVMRISLSGTGLPIPAPSIRVDPRIIDFGETLVGTSETRNITLENPGSADLHVSAITMAGDSSEQFIYVGPGSATLGPDENLVISVGYDPDVVGDASGSLTIESDAPGNELISVSLSGAGSPVPTPKISVTPDIVDFGETSIGDTTARSIRLRNAGSAALRIFGIELEAGGSAEFDFDVILPLDLEPNGDHELEVRFTPLNRGEPSAILLFRSDDPLTGVVSVTLRGSVPDLPTRPFRRGESNGDGTLNLTDAVFTLRYLFLNGEIPPCLDSADADDNGRLNITDAVITLNHLFRGGGPLPEPGQAACGVDPTPDDLPACEYPVEQC